MKSALLLIALGLVTNLANAKNEALNFSEPENMEVKVVYYNHEVHLKVIRILQRLPIQKRMIASHWDSIRDKMKKQNPKTI